MRLDVLLIGIVIGFFFMQSGYRAIGLWICILSFLGAFLLERKKKVRVGKGELEPIIIESTRGAPYRIPGEMDISYSGKWHGGEKTWAYKAVDKPLSPIANWIGRKIKGEGKE